MTTISYLPHYLTSEQIEDAQKNILRMQRGERGGLKLKKLQGLPLYSLRLNIAHRLLLIKKYGQWVVVEYVPFHELDKAKCTKPQVLKELLGTDFEPVSFDWTMFAETEELPLTDELTWVPAYLHGHRPIFLDDNQQQSLTLKQPGLIIGPPGSGKTSVSFAILQQYVLQCNIENPTISYIVPTLNLKNELEKLWKKNPLAEMSRVEFKTYADLILPNTFTMITKEQFQHWLFGDDTKLLKKQNKEIDWNALSKQYEEIRFEFSLIKALGNEAYQKAGIDACCFFEKRPLLQQLFKSYKAYLIKEKLSCPYLAEIKEPTQYDLTFIDEGQNFSPFQHLQLAKLSTHNNALYICVDTEQCINTSRLIEGHIQQTYYSQNRALNLHLLTHTYRCPPAVVSLVNELMHYGNAHEPKKTSHHYKTMTSMVQYPGECFYYECIDESNKAYLDSLCQSPDTLVIIPDESFTSVELQQLNTSLKFTAPQVIGFDAENVILVHPFNTAVAQNFARRTPEKPPTLQEWAWFRALFVAFTRAGKRLVIIQPDNHVFEDILTTLKKRCQQGQGQVPLQPQENDQNKWIQRHQQALEQGLTTVVRDIRLQHPDIHFIEPAIDDTHPPIPSVAKPKLPKIPLLTKKQIIDWCDKGEEELKKQLGLNHKNKLEPLFQWLQEPENISVLMNLVTQNKRFQHQLKSLLMMKPWANHEGVDQCFMYALINQKHSYPLLETLCTSLTPTEELSVKFLLEKINQATNLTWLDMILQHSKFPFFMKLFNNLDDKSWFNRLTYKGEAGRLVDVMTLEPTPLQRLGALLHHYNQWAFLSEGLGAMPTDPLNCPTPILLLEWMSFKGQLSGDTSVTEVLTNLLKEKPEIYLQLFDVNNRKLCLLSLMIDYFLKKDSTSEPYLLFIESLKQYFTNLKMRENFILVITDAVHPVSGASIITKLLADDRGQRILTIFMVELPGFRQVLCKIMTEKLEDIQKYTLKQNGYDPATAQYYHFIQNNGSRTLDASLIDWYVMMIAFFKRYIKDDDNKMLSAFNVASSKQGTYLNDSFKGIQCVAKNHFITTEQWDYLAIESSAARQIMAHVLFEQKGIPHRNALKFMATLFALMHLDKKISIIYSVEYVTCKNTSAVVINRTQFLETDSPNAYNDAFILDEAFELMHYHYLPDNHPFKIAIKEVNSEGHLLAYSPFNLAFEIQTFELLNEGAKGVIEAFYRQVNQYLLLPLLLIETALTAKDLSSDTSSILVGFDAVARKQALTNLFKENSFQQLKQLLLKKTHQNVSILRYMLANGAVDDFIELLKVEKPRLKLFLLLKEECAYDSQTQTFVYVMLLSHQNGLKLLNAMAEYLEQDKEEALSIFKQWIEYAYSPENKYNGDKILIKDLINKLGYYKIIKGPLVRLFNRLCEKIQDWQFAMPCKDTLSHVPFIYVLLQPAYREHGFIPSSIWKIIYRYLTQDYQLFITPFLNELGVKTTIFREMALHSKNHEFFSLIDCLKPSFIALIDEQVLFDKFNLDMSYFLEQTLFGQLIHCPPACRIVYDIYFDHPEYFEGLIKQVKTASRDSSLFQYMQKTVYSRHLLRLWCLADEDDFNISEEVLWKYINAIAIPPINAVCDSFYIKPIEADAILVLLEEKLAALKKYDATRGWDWTFIHNEADNFINSIRTITLTIAKFRDTQKAKPLNLIGVILAYALSRYILPYSYDFEIKLCPIKNSEWVLFFNPTHQKRSMAYMVKENKLLLNDQQINIYLKSKLNNSEGVNASWSNFIGLNFLRYYTQTQIKLHQDNQALKASLEDLLTFISTDFLFGGKFDRPPEAKMIGNNRNTFHSAPVVTPVKNTISRSKRH